MKPGKMGKPQILYLFASGPGTGAMQHLSNCCNRPDREVLLEGFEGNVKLPILIQKNLQITYN